MIRLAKWWFWSQIIIGTPAGIWLGVMLSRLPAACVERVAEARSGADLVAVLEGCPEASFILELLAYLP